MMLKWLQMQMLIKQRWKIKLLNRLLLRQLLTLKMLGKQLSRPMI
jgi:hypothetical protein